MIIYLLEYVVTELPSFGKEGCPPGGVVGKEYFDLFYIGVAKTLFLLPPPPSGTPPSGRRRVDYTVMSSLSRHLT